MVTRVQRGRGLLRMPFQQLLALMTLTCACLLLLLTAPVSGDYGAKDDVVVLTEKNFEKEVMQSGDYWLVEFYAPWCVLLMYAVYDSRVADSVSIAIVLVFLSVCG